MWRLTAKPRERRDTPKSRPPGRRPNLWRRLSLRAQRRNRAQVRTRRPFSEMFAGTDWLSSSERRYWSGLCSQLARGSVAVLAGVTAERVTKTTLTGEQTVHAMVPCRGRITQPEDARIPDEAA